MENCKVCSNTSKTIVWKKFFILITTFNASSHNSTSFHTLLSFKYPVNVDGTFTITEVVEVEAVAEMIVDVPVIVINIPEPGKVLVQQDGDDVVKYESW